MWILIKIDNEKDIGNNEQRRVVVLDEPIFEKYLNKNKYSIMNKKITLIGTEVHPMTKGD